MVEGEPLNAPPNHPQHLPMHLLCLSLKSPYPMEHDTIYQTYAGRFRALSWPRLQKLGVVVVVGMEED